MAAIAAMRGLSGWPGGFSSGTGRSPAAAQRSRPLARAASINAGSGARWRSVGGSSGKWVGTERSVPGTEGHPNAWFFHERVIWMQLTARCVGRYAISSTFRHNDQANGGMKTDS